MLSRTPDTNDNFLRALDTVDIELIFNLQGNYLI